MRTTKQAVGVSALVLAALACSLTDRPQAGIVAKAVEPERAQAVTVLVTSTIPTAKPVVCVVVTGVQDGRVNLRTCPGLTCGVVGVLAEGDNLIILQPGEWSQVRTLEGVTGYVKSEFCK